MVSIVKEKAREKVKELGLEYILIDGPPGIGCPVIATIGNIDLAVIVCEPTLSSVTNLDRVVGVARHFNVPVAVCINKYDLNEENSRRVEELCKEIDVPVIGKLPYDTTVTEAMIHGKAIVEFSDSEFSDRLREIWNTITGMVG
jgi:MinD superfamily P-loop ATPase